jgi:indole-3-glycerol phosphate synthase
MIISESGIETSDDLSLLAKAGVDAVIIGEFLLQQDDLEKAVRILLKGKHSSVSL